jgi:hypothetical protein
MENHGSIGRPADPAVSPKVFEKPGHSPEEIEVLEWSRSRADSDAITNGNADVAYGGKDAISVHFTGSGIEDRRLEMQAEKDPGVRLFLDYKAFYIPARNALFEINDSVSEYFKEHGDKAPFFNAVKKFDVALGELAAHQPEFDRASHPLRGLIEELKGSRIDLRSPGSEEGFYQLLQRMRDIVDAQCDVLFLVVKLQSGGIDTYETERIRQQLSPNDSGSSGTPEASAN